MSGVRDLFQKARKLGMPGIAITDHGTLAAAAPFLAIAPEFPEVKPIVGCEFWITDHSDHTIKRFESKGTYHLILLAKNKTGYHNLVKLCSIASTEGLCVKPRISHALLERYRDGLICTSACIGGEVPRKILADDKRAAKEAALWYQRLFGDDFYLEVSLHKNFGPVKLSRQDDREAYRERNHDLVHLQEKANAGIFEIGQELGIKVVATNDVHFVERGEGMAHDAMLCVTYNCTVSDKNRIRYSHLEYMKSEDEMRRLFPDHPEAIENTMEIVDKVERYEIFQKPDLPVICENPEASLRSMVYEGAAERYGSVSKDVRERIEYELSVIVKTGYAAYFLIMKELADWAKREGIALGPGRGNSAGSIVNYCLGITRIDPILHGLCFDRFYNPEESSPFCIDLDVEVGSRERIYDHLKERYGFEAVGYISTYGCSLLKASWQKVGSEAFAAADRLQRIKKRTGIHLCGVLLSCGKMSDYVPVEKDEDGNLVSVYDGSYAPRVGLLKFDFLELRTLNVIKEAVRMIGESRGVRIDIESIPMDDRATLELFRAGDTEGIFQFESQRMRERLKEFKSLDFQDLVVMNALYRPGSLILISSYIARRNGEKPIEYAAPGAETIMACTRGLPVYQEQIMQLALKYSMLSRRQIDGFRRKILYGKNLYEAFVSTGVVKGYSKEDLEEIWIEYLSRARYTFPKAHVVCYTWIGYQCAWLKAHYPEEYAAACAKYEVR